MTKRPIVQIGLGGWGWSWLEIVRASPHWQLAGIVDRDRGVLDRAIATYGLDPASAATSLGECATLHGADAALVVVPPEFHAPVTCEAVEAGLHCLVEKPVAGTIADAVVMVDAAARHDRRLMVSQNYRFRRAAETVRRLVASGVIGEIGMVYVNFQKAPPFTGFRTEMAQPLITDMAVHHFDQVRGLLGLEPQSVVATTCNPKWSWFRGDAVVNVVFTMTNGARVVYTGSWVSRGWETTWDGDWRIQGELGEIHWADNQVDIIPRDVFTSVFVPGARENRGRITADRVALAAEDRAASLAEFHAAISEGREPVPSGRDNLRSLAMVLGACEAAASRGSCDISALLPPSPTLS